MESLIAFATEHAHAAHWVFFLLIMLAGLNVPISEDIILITAGALASTNFPEGTYHLYAWLFLACWLSAWEAYWLGRLVGPKLYNIKWFNYIITRERVDRLHHYYEKFGILTFMVGRFIPGGVRNALFMTCGLGKMPFHKFIFRDLPACLLSSSVLFSVGYLFGKNTQTIINFVKTYNVTVVTILLSALALYLVIRRIRKPSDHTNHDTQSLP